MNNNKELDIEHSQHSREQGIGYQAQSTLQTTRNKKSPAMTTTPPSSPPTGSPAPPVAVVPPPPMVVAPSLKPTKPTMGNISAMTTREWSAWTGGKPKYDWSGLDASAPSDYTTPNQLHLIHVSLAQKGYNHRCKGIDNKFAKGSNHFNFARLVWKHLVDTGMDTVAYLPSTKDPQEMVSIVQYYSQYSLKTTREHYKATKTKLDHYDVNNDVATRDFLVDSLELKLHDMVSKKLKDDDGFLVTWLQLIKSIQTTNIEHYKTLKEQVKACRPSQFPGQNVTTLVSTFRVYAHELDNTYAYDHNMTLTMLKTFLLAGGDDYEDYRMDLCIKKKELKIVHHMGYDEVKEHMTKQDLTSRPSVRSLRMPTVSKPIAASGHQLKTFIMIQLLLLPPSRPSLLPIGRTLALRSMPCFKPR